MDWTGIIAGALGGGANAAQGMAQGYIEDERKADLAKQISAMEEAKGMRAMQAQQDMAFAGQQRERDRVKSMLAGAGTDLNKQGDAALAAGDVNTAEAIAKYQTAGEKTTPYGGITKDRFGNLITDNSLGRQQADIMRAQARAEADANKMPKAAEMQLASIDSRSKQIQASIDKVMSDPMFDPAKPPPGLQQFQQEQRQLQMQQLQIYARHGVINGADDAQGLVQNEKDPDAIKAAVKRAYMLGPKYGAAFAATVEASHVLDPLPSATGGRPTAADALRADPMTSSPAGAGGVAQPPSKDWLGAGWSYNGKSYPTEQAAYEAAGMPMPEGLVSRFSRALKTTNQRGETSGRSGSTY